MILVAKTKQEINIAKEILNERIYLQPTNEFKALLLLDKRHRISWIVGYDGRIGKTMQMHVANVSENSFLPKVFIVSAFDYPFNYLNIDIVFGIVNGANKKAMNFDKKLGFTEKMRWKGMHDDGGDLVLFEMHKKKL